MELSISIAITALIIAGTTFFISKVDSDIQNTKNRTQVHMDITTFIEKMNSARMSFSSGTIITGAASGYSTILFTNTGGTSGMLVGVVDANNLDSSGSALLDPNAAYSTYGKKLIAMTELTKSQTQTIVALTGAALTGAVYAVPFRNNKTFPSLSAASFQANSYNTGALIEIDATVYEQYLSLLKWQSVASINPGNTLSFHLVF